MDKLNQQQLDFILKSAILAPSADNQHKICFEVTGNIIRIRYTGTEFPPEGGYKWVLALLSLGAMSENITLAASRFGFQSEIILSPDLNHRPDWIIQICLRPNQAKNGQLWKEIPLRHTNRRIRFYGPRMTDAEQGELDKSVHAFPACELAWLDEPVLRKQSLHLIRRAETERFHNPLLHEELFSAIRFDIGWHTTCTEGLPPGALGVEPPLRGFFSLLRHWPVMRLTNFLGMHYILGLRSSYIPCRLAPHLGVLTVKNFDSHSVLHAGRAFQRLWLTITRQGRVLQPMPASALYALEGALTESIPVALQRELSSSWQAIFRGSIPLMLFRMGNAGKPPIVAGRPEDNFISKSKITRKQD